MAKKTKMTAKPIISRKLRPVDIMGKAIKHFIPEGEGEMTKLYTIYGKARSVRAGVSTFGEFHVLKGMFQAIRTEDGQEFMSAECFLPEPMHGHITNRYIAAAEKKEDPPLLEFAFDIFLKESKVPVGYEYVTVPIVQPEETNDLADLRSKALTGPTEDAAALSSVPDLGDAASL